MSLWFTKAEVLELISNATETCAPVTVTIGKDHVLIINCPPIVVQQIMESCGHATWTISVTGGGLRIDVKG